MAKKKSNSRNIVQEFADYFGSESKLTNWQRLCADLDIDDDLGSITKCKAALRKVYVNIYDLIDAKRNNTAVRRFATYRKLVNYTISTGKIYPKRKAKESGPVKLLLKPIF